MASLLEAPPEALCVLRLSAVGDTCHAVPVVRSIQAAWPETRIVWIIGRAEHTLLEGLSGVEFVVFDKSKGWSAYRDVRRTLKRWQFGALLHMHASLKANLVSTAVHAPLKLGYDRARARDFQWLFCNRSVAAVGEQHVMDAMFEFARALGIQRGALRWDIPVAEADEAFAEQQIGEARTVIISPCTGQRFRNYRHWSPERYAAIADYASRRYAARVLLTGGTSAIERDYAARIVELAESRPVDLIGRTTLKQLLALLRRAALLVCPDSGPAHMATAVGTRVVGLYATSNRFRTGPYLSQEFVVDKYPQAVRREFGCEVGDLRWGRRVRNPDAMSLISVEEVAEKVDGAFASAGVAPAR